MVPILATKVSLITVCRGELSVHHDMINCFADIRTEERARCYSETRSISNVSGTYIYNIYIWKETNVLKLVGTL